MVFQVIPDYQVTQVILVFLVIAVQEHLDTVDIQETVAYQVIPVYQDNQDLVATQAIQVILETVVFPVTAVAERPVTADIRVLVE